MRKQPYWWAGWLGLSFWLMISLPAYAQVDPNSVRWQATYWDNATLAGEPVVTQTEIGLNYNWRDTRPGPALPSDRYSARWTTTVDLPAGDYRFTVGADDGVRLWVDEQLVVDEWGVRSFQTYDAQVRLGGGPVPLRVDYFENTGQARVFLTWQPLGQVVTPAPLPPTGSDGVWRGEYYNDADLQGNPDFVRTDNQINFDWGVGSPAPGFIDRDRFTVRWQSTQDLPAGQYRFTITMDDGVRLWVDNNLLIDQWRVQSERTYRAEFTWSGGPLPVRMEYFEERGNAVAQLTWAQVGSGGEAPDAVGAPVNFWHGEYYNNVNLAGEPALVRNDEEINFTWGSGSPAEGIIRSDRFSARWTRTLSLAPGRYQFTATVDDGVRLWVNEALVIDAWALHDTVTLQTIVNVIGGATPVRMEYFENSDQARARLTWVRSGDTIGSAIPAEESATVTGARYLNVRAGPGINYGRRTVVAGGAEVAVLGRSAGGIWVQIQLADGTVGWVNSRYLAYSFPFAALPVVQ